MWSLRNGSTRSTISIKARGVGDPRDIREGKTTDRQELIRGFDQQALSGAKIGLVGAGGLNGVIGLGLARKGVGAMEIFDNDTVERSNLSRQMFYKKDLHKKKALRLPRSLARECIGPTEITGYDLRFQDALEMGLPLDADVYVFGVDNDEARVLGCRTLLGRDPAVFLGTGPEANNAYVFVQEPGHACFGCLFPDVVDRASSRQACVPSSIDIVMSIGGIALYAIDSLLMKRPRRWNFRQVFLDGSLPDHTVSVERREACPECGGKQENTAGIGEGQDVALAL